MLAGDSFDLSVDPAGSDPARSLAALLAPHTELAAALRAHLQAGHPLTLLGGNHDAGVATTRAAP